MPIYEYVCRHCRNEFEQITSFSSASMPACPRCASGAVERKLSSPAIHFKGSGWYVTDSKNSAKKSANGKSEAEGAGSGEESKAETPAANTEAAAEKKSTASGPSDGKSTAPAKEAANSS